MNAQYKRDMNHNYLILPGENLDTASYQVRILVGNTVPALLKCRIQGLDGAFMVYYDITSKQSLETLYEKKKFGGHDLQMLFGGIVRVLEEMSEYLLNPGQLVIAPGYIYLDAEREEVKFCCLPGYGRDIPEQIRTLTEYLLPKLDHEDGKAVMLGYGIYRRAMEDTFHLEALKEELYRVREVQEEAFAEKEIPEAPPFWEEKEVGPVEALEVDTEENWFREEKGEKHPKKIAGKRVPALFLRILGCAAGAAGCLGIVLAGFWGYLPWLNVEVFLGVVIVGMGAGMLLHLLWRKRKGRRTAHPAGSDTRADSIPLQRENVQDEKVTAREKKEAENVPKITESFGETVVLSAGKTDGPATLVSREPGELATIYLQEEITVIGKLATAADAVVPLPTVSRLHAKIRKRDGEYYLSDLNSRNGTSVNGVLLKGDEEHHLEDEDEIDFAQARYVFLK